MVRRRQGRAGALHGGRPGRRRSARRPRLRRLLRPQVPRHPDHRRTSGTRGRARSARSYLNFHAQGGVAMLTRGRRGLPGRRGRCRAAGARRRSPSRCSPATPSAPPHILAQAGAGRPRGGVRRHRLRRERRGGGQAVRPAPDGGGARHPAGRDADATIRPVLRRRPRRSRRAPTCSSSVERSPAPTTRLPPRRPSSTRSPESHRPEDRSARAPLRHSACGARRG